MKFHEIMATGPDTWCSCGQVRVYRTVREWLEIKDTCIDEYFRDSWKVKPKEYTFTKQQIEEAWCKMGHDRSLYDMCCMLGIRD